MLFLHLTQQEKITEPESIHFSENEEYAKFEHDMKDIKGQQQAKRALEIKAAGAHNILLKGPLGAG